MAELLLLDTVVIVFLLWLVLGHNYKKEFQQIWAYLNFNMKLTRLVVIEALVFRHVHAVLLLLDRVGVDLGHQGAEVVLLLVAVEVAERKRRGGSALLMGVQTSLSGYIGQVVQVLNLFAVLNADIVVLLMMKGLESFCSNGVVGYVTSLVLQDDSAWVRAVIVGVCLTSIVIVVIARHY